jgi:hypothetical protein
MTMLKKTHSHFIRCIKSNEACLARQFDAPLVYKQLIYSGVFEVVKIQQSGLPCRLPHFDFIDRYKCLTPSKLRWSFFSATDMLHCLLKLNYDLQQARVGQTLVFFKSFEQKLLENRRHDLLQEQSSKISVFLQKQHYRCAFLQIRGHYREFQNANSDLDSTRATPAFQSFAEGCQILHAYTRRACLQHVIDHMDHELSLLDQRVALIEEAKLRLEERTKTGIQSLEDILGRAIDLEITFHPIIHVCKETSQRYYRAIEFVDVVHRSDQMHDASAYVTLISDWTSNVGEMDFQSFYSKLIEEGILLLQEFSHIVDDAPIALEFTLQYFNLVKEEIEEIGEPIARYLELSALAFDHDAGIMIPLYPEDGQQAFESLQALTVKFEEKKFLSVEVQGLFEDAVDYIYMVENYVEPDDAAGAIHYLLVHISHNRTLSTILSNQVVQLQYWAEIQSSPEKFRDLLLQNCVPGSQSGLEDPVSYKEIEELITRLNKLTKPSLSIQSVIRAGEWIVKVYNIILSILLSNTYL